MKEETGFHIQSAIEYLESADAQAKGMRIEIFAFAGDQISDRYRGAEMYEFVEKANGPSILCVIEDQKIIAIGLQVSLCIF